MYPVINFQMRAALPLLLVVTMLILSGCSTAYFSNNSHTRIASDLPDYFLVGTHSGTDTNEPMPNEGCRNPMVDPLDDTKLELVRSNGEHGDYKVPDGRYGVGRRELLRINCSTGRAVGIVRK